LKHACTHTHTHTQTHTHTHTHTLPIPPTLQQNTGGGSEGSGQKLESTGSCLPKFATMPFIECNVKGCHFYNSDISFWLADLVNLEMMERLDAAEVAMGRGVSRCAVCRKTYT